MMAWQYHRYGLDQPDAKQTLSDLTWPLARWGRSRATTPCSKKFPTTVSGGKRFSLPVSVSPEYGGDGPGAWGRDASFQLAALHRICRILPEAARAAESARLTRAGPTWTNACRPTPSLKASTWSEWHLSNERIGLWQGTDLDGSHRHHSHLAGIYPFATIDLNDPVRNAKSWTNSLTTWRFRGAGGWSGWCVPWASMLMSRTRQAEAAVSWLHYWKDNYTNEGRGTLHNANNNGTSMLGAPDWTREKQNREVMQLDGGFGALSAVLELLVQNARRCHLRAAQPAPHLARPPFRPHPHRWYVSGGGHGNGRELYAEIRVKSLVGGKLRLAHGLGDAISAKRSGAKRCYPRTRPVASAKC